MCVVVNTGRGEIKNWNVQGGYGWIAIFKLSFNCFSSNWTIEHCSLFCLVFKCITHTETQYSELGEADRQMFSSAMNSFYKRGWLKNKITSLMLVIITHVDESGA